MKIDFNKKWKKYDKNPVFGNRETGTVFDAQVTKFGGEKFRMYFSWRCKKALAYTESSDAIHWSEPKICMESNPANGWEDDINRSCVIYKDGKYLMWYTGQARGFSKIGYAVSEDGVKFERVLNMPVMVPEYPYEGFSVMNPYVIWDEEKNLFRMWYASGETHEPNVLCYAESQDGIKWEKSLLNPIYVKGNKGAWDCDRVGGCEVHRLPDGNYLMFYIGYSDIDTARIGAAISPDGVTCWKQAEGNPLICPSKDTFDACACYKPTVFIDEDKIYLWYNGRTGDEEYIGLAILDL